MMSCCTTDNTEAKRCSKACTDTCSSMSICGIIAKRHGHHCSVLCRKRSRQSQSFAAPFKSFGSAHLPPLLPAPAMTPWGPPQPACWPLHPSQTSGQCVAPYNWSQAAPPTAAAPAPNIALTISEMLSQPQVRHTMYQGL